MSRTARTIPARLHDGDQTWVHVVQLTALRYSNAESAKAAREGRRPQPQQVRRHIEVFGYMALDCRRGWFPAYIAEDEGSARANARDACASARGLHRAGNLDDFDVPPVRHRHAALGRAW